MKTLSEMNSEPEFKDRVTLVPYAYDTIVPARVGRDAQDIINSYMLRPEDADIFICMLWQRMGTPMERFINPATNQPYQSGTEYEFLMAYGAAQHSPTPVILLYRKTLPAAEPQTDEERIQRAHVAAFFNRFSVGGDLKGLVGSFTDDDSLERTLKQDVTRIVRDDILPLIEKRQLNSPTDSVRFGLPPLPNGHITREVAQDALRKALLGSRVTVGVVSATTLHGMGGLGKTVLARAICDDPLVQAAFPGGVLWSTVGQQPDIARLQREWIHALGGDITAAIDPETGRAELERLIGDRAMLLVLDDVWRTSDARVLMLTCPRCRTLITTRDADQTPGAALVALELMRREECRMLLHDATRGRVTDLTTLDAITQRLGSLPLALQIIGALLGLGITWPEVEDALNKGELREMRTGQQSLFVAIAASVSFLSVDDQTRYRELVIFPEDEPLNTVAVARLWQQTGGLSAFASKRLLLELQERSLIQADGKLHDLQLDYLRADTRSEQRKAWHETLVNTYGSIEAWGELPEDDAQYGWRWLAWHLNELGRVADLHLLLTDAAYLRGKISRLGTSAVLRDLALQPNDVTLRTIASAILAGKALLEYVPDEVRNQVFGRTRPSVVLHDTRPETQPRFEMLWPSLPLADNALRQVLLGHNGSVEGCVFSPDGKYILSASTDHTLRLWDVATGQEIRQFLGHTDRVNSCAFSPDGRFILSSSGTMYGPEDTSVRLWDVATGQEIRQFLQTPGPFSGGVFSCAFSPSGQFAIGIGSYAISLWDVATGQEIRQISTRADMTGGGSFSPDGRSILAASDLLTLQLWDVSSGQALRQFAIPDDEMAFDCAFDPTGRYILGAGGKVMLLWDSATGEELHQFIGHSDVVSCCAFSPDGRFTLSGSWDRTLRLWDVSTGQELHRFMGHMGKIASCAFSPDGRFALSGSEDGTVQLWEIGGEQLVGDSHGHAERITDCVFSPDGQYALSASADRSMQLWDVASGQVVRRFSGHDDTINCCAFSADSQAIVSASDDKTVRLWDVVSGQEMRQFLGHTGTVLACELSSDGRYIVSASIDKTVRLWDGTTGQEMRQFIGHTGSVNKCAFSPDIEAIGSASIDKTVRLWDIATGQEIHQFARNSPPFSDFIASKDRKYALYVGSSDDLVLGMIDIPNNLPLGQWVLGIPLTCLALHPFGNMVLVGDEAGDLHLLRIQGITVEDGPISPFAFLDFLIENDNSDNDSEESE